MIKIPHSILVGRSSQLYVLTRHASPFDYGYIGMLSEIFWHMSYPKVRCTLFFVMELATRKVFFAPVKLQPDGKYMRQVVRILTDSEDGFLHGKRYLIHDRDPLYRTGGFHATLRSSGIEPVKLFARSPDLNCYAERFVKSIKSKCLEHLILSSVEQLKYVIEQYSAYYHHERIHQGVGRIIEPKHPIDERAEIICIERLGGLLKSYHRLAA